MDLTTFEEICTSLREEESLSRVTEDLIQLIRPAIRMVVNEEPVEEGQIPIGASKLGGQPDLPEGWEWPVATLDIPSPTPEFIQAASQIPHLVLPPPDNRVSLPFVAQVRLSELADVLPNNPLPSEGILYFFYNSELFASDGGEKTAHAGIPALGISVSYDDFGFDDPRNCRVLYYPNEKAQWGQRTPPESVPVNHVYEARSVSFQAIHTLPGGATSFIGEIGDEREVVSLDREESEVYWEMLAKLMPHVDHLLGYSQDALPDALAASYVHFRSYLFPELPQWETLSLEEQQREYQSCSLLLQVEQHDNGIYFGRNGVLGFFIRNEDLVRRDFSRVWAWTQ